LNCVPDLLSTNMIISYIGRNIVGFGMICSPFPSWERKEKNIEKHNLHVVLCGYETWSLTVREEYRLRVFEKKVLRRIFGYQAQGVRAGWRNCIKYSFIICIFLHIFLERKIEDDLARLYV
jgi:hypothetical protein